MIYKVTVTLFVEANYETEVTDCVGEILRENERQYHPQSGLLDWKFDGLPSKPSSTELAEIEETLS